VARRITVILDWGHTGTSATGPDGTEYMIQGETVRGEPRYYEALYLAPGQERSSANWKTVPIGDGSSDIRSQRTRCRRHAEQLQEAARA
jgi:hypothetical protein